ncbi:MAG: glycosyltransferase family 39 protein [Candidatus Nealsonbacteria bacterium]|nr:glycosyltransferase family 39 protein [Candidatus Nealsonbacteria bacterium]
MLKKDLINIVLIIILILIIGGVGLKFIPSFPVISDSEGYDVVAQNLIQGKGFIYNDKPIKESLSNNFVGYPVFLASIYYLFGHDYQIVKFIQFLLLGGMAIIVYLMTRKFLDLSPLLALLSSLTLILWPYFIFYPTLIVSETLFIFFFLLLIYFLLSFSKKPSLKNSLLVGGLLGIAALVRPVALFLPFWIVFFLLIFLKPLREKVNLLKLVIVLIVFFAVLSPWGMATHQLNPISNHLLQSIITKAYVRLDYTEGSQALKPGETSLKTMALARLKNIYLFWNPGAEGANAQTIKETFPIMGVLFHIYKIFFFIVLALAFWSLKWIRRKKEILILWIVIFYFWSLHIVFWPYPRYTLPIIPLIIVLAWFSLQNIGYKILNRNLNKTEEKT